MSAVIRPPRLEYSLWGEGFDVSGIIADGPPLYAANSASVSVHRGRLTAFIQGPMLKRDGTRAQHTRITQARPHPDQPEWLTRLFADAARRLTDALNEETPA